MATQKKYAVCSEAIDPTDFGEGYCVYNAPNAKAAIQMYVGEMIGEGDAHRYVYVAHEMPTGKRFKAETILKVTEAKSV